MDGLRGAGDAHAKLLPCGPTILLGRRKPVNRRLSPMRPVNRKLVCHQGNGPKAFCLVLMELLLLRRHSYILSVYMYVVEGKFTEHEFERTRHPRGSSI